MALIKICIVYLRRMLSLFTSCPVSNESTLKKNSSYKKKEKQMSVLKFIWSRLSISLLEALMQNRYSD